MIVNKEMKEHMIDALKKGLRFDGRKNDELRKAVVEYDVSMTAEGSAKVSLGDTVVIAGVKLSVEKPYPDTPDEGMLMVNAEFMPMANPDFESGPPSSESVELARVVDKGIRECRAIDTKKLCIEPGEKAWSVGIDIMTMNDDGNLLDAAGLAAMAALKVSRLPKLNEDGTISYDEKTDEKLPVSKEPMLVTVHMIGDEIIVDPKLDEEHCSDARISVSYVDDKTICAIQKGGEKALTIDQIDKMVGVAMKKAKELRKAL